METIIHNIANEELLEESYLQLAQKLGESGYKAEECYTYECICRLFKDNEEKRLIYEKKIKDLNRDKCQNSYDLFKMYKSSIEFEFPLQNPQQEDNAIYDINRYLAIIHSMLLEKVQRDEELLIQVINSARVIKNILQDKLMNIENADFINQVKTLVSQEELKAAEKIYAEQKNVIFLKIAITYGYKKESIYLDILADYVDKNEYSDALDFYNEYYIAAYKAEKVENEEQLLNYLSSRFYCYGSFYKSLEFKEKALKKYLITQGEIDE